MPTRTLTATLLALLVAGSAAAQDADPELRPGAPGVTGVVVDRETREPIDGVAVRLEPMDSTAERPGGFPVVLTGPEGRFFLGDLPDGEYRLVLERIGYREVTDSVVFRRDIGLRVEGEMVPEAVDLEPLLVVTDARSRNLQAAGFYDRRRRGLGRFVSRQEIEERRLLRASDLFRTMPGVRMSSTGRFGERGVVLLRAGCEADVWIDGVRASSPFPMDDIVQLGDLDGVEVYHGSQVPPRFGPSTCGTVVIWTHLPNPGTGRPWSWKRLLAAVGFIGLSVFLLN